MTTQRLFGTDGIRGRAGAEPLDRSTVAALGAAIASWLRDRNPQPSVVLGGDTRASTPEIEAWLGDTLSAGGVVVRSAGVIPTPGIAWLVPQLACDAGIVVSASHNPYHDNGIKLLSQSGHKFSHEIEQDIEDRLLELRGKVPERDSGSLDIDAGLRRRYRDALAATAGPESLTGLKIVLDTANGAASPIAARLFRDCGADITVFADQPDGTNINRDCGSTHPEKLSQLVLDTGADLGLAFDGDADRVVAVDESGRVRDGDAILYLWALDLAAANSLSPSEIVATSMSNLGLEHALAKAGVSVVRCAVGDRAVVNALQDRGLRLGGEQSGHIVDLHSSTTGDGLLTGLRLASIMQRSKRSLSEILAPLPKFPQLLLNVKVASRPPIEEIAPLAGAIREVESVLGDEGRLVVRYSGTEPLLRIMIEGRDAEMIETAANDLAAVVREHIPPRDGAA